MKRVCILFLSLLLVFSLSACSGQTQRAETYTYDTGLCDRLKKTDASEIEIRVHLEEGCSLKTTELSGLKAAERLTLSFSGGEAEEIEIAGIGPTVSCVVLNFNASAGKLSFQGLRCAELVISIGEDGGEERVDWIDLSGISKCEGLTIRGKVGIPKEEKVSTHYDLSPAKLTTGKGTVVVHSDSEITAEGLEIFRVPHVAISGEREDYSVIEGWEIGLLRIADPFLLSESDVLNCSVSSIRTWDGGMESYAAIGSHPELERMEIVRRYDIEKAPGMDMQPIDRKDAWIISHRLSRLADDSLEKFLERGGELLIYVVMDG